MADEKKNYTIKAFVRTYTGETLDYWRPCSDRAVEAASALEAESTATAQIKEELKRENIRLGDLLVDSIIRPDGSISQMAAWDESGFPIG